MSNQVAKDNTVTPDNNALNKCAVIGDYMSDAEIDSLLEQWRKALHARQPDGHKEVAVRDDFKKIVVDQIASAISKKISVSHFDIEILEPINPDSDLLPLLCEKVRFLSSSLITEAYDLHRDWLGRYLQILPEVQFDKNALQIVLKNRINNLSQHLPNTEKFRVSDFRDFILYDKIDDYYSHAEPLIKKAISATKINIDVVFPAEMKQEIMPKIHKIFLFNRAYQADKEAILKQLNHALKLQAKNRIVTVPRTPTPAPK